MLDFGVKVARATRLRAQVRRRRTSRCALRAQRALSRRRDIWDIGAIAALFALSGESPPDRARILTMAADPSRPGRPHHLGFISSSCSRSMVCTPEGEMQRSRR